jgi:pyrroline-5-carboxylate reductase
MAQYGVDSFANLRQKVTSPNGTTYAALMHMEANNVPDSLRDAVVKAAERSAELGDDMSRMNAP